MPHGPCNGDSLPLAAGKAFCGDVHAFELHAQSILKDGGRLFGHFAVVEHGDSYDFSGQFRAQEQVLRRCQVVHYREVLVNRVNAIADGIRVAGHHQGVAIECHMALGGLVHPGENLDQRRFTRAIVANNRKHFTRTGR